MTKNNVKLLTHMIHLSVLRKILSNSPYLNQNVPHVPPCCLPKVTLIDVYLQNISSVNINVNAVFIV